MESAAAAAQISTNFGAIDWVIVAAYLSGSVLIGLLVRRYVTNMTDFVVAGRAVSKWLGIATVIGTEMGLVTVMYAAQAGFTSGFSAFHIPLIMAAMALVVGLTGLGLVPLRRMGVLTIPEFFRRRYGHQTAALGALILVMAGVLNMGLFLKAGAYFVTNITGLANADYLKWIMTAMLGMVLAYTMLGGMLSVVLTDYVQFVMLSIGVFVATALALHNVDWSNMVSTVSESYQRGGFDPFKAEGFGTPYVLFMCFVGIAACVTWQPNVMRACAAKDTKTVKAMFSWASVGFMVRFLIPCLWGICALTYIMGNPDFRSLFRPENGEAVKNTMEAMPFFLGQILPTGILGIMTAAMLAAFMSTHDSYLLSWSSVIVQDIVAPMFPRGLSQQARIWCTRVAILAIGLFLLYWGLWYEFKDQGLWDYMAITGSIYFAGAMVVILAGIYWKRASSTGAVAAMIAGTLSLLALKPLLDPLRKAVSRFLEGRIGMSEAAMGKVLTWFSTGGITLGASALAVILLVVFSLAFPDEPEIA